MSAIDELKELEARLKKRWSKTPHTGFDDGYNNGLRETFFDDYRRLALEVAAELEALHIKLNQAAE